MWMKRCLKYMSRWNRSNVAERAPRARDGSGSPVKDLRCGTVQRGGPTKEGPRSAGTAGRDKPALADSPTRKAMR